MTKCRAKDADQDDGLASTTNVALALARLLAKAAARERFTNHEGINVRYSNMIDHDNMSTLDQDGKDDC